MVRVRSFVFPKTLKSAATFLSPVVLCLVVAMGLQPSARAQVQFLGQTLSTTDYGLGESINGQPIEGGPWQVAVNASGTIAAGTVNANQIVRINPDGTHSVAFTSSSGPIFAVAIDNAGNIYTNNQSTLWKIAPNGTVTSTDLGFESEIDNYCISLQNEGAGNAPNCEYYTAAEDLAIDPQGNVYLAYGPPFWWVLEAPAGGGHPFLLDTSPLIMNSPSGLATDSQGNVYIGDVYNNRIIVVTPVGQSNYGVSPPGLALGSPDGTINGVTLYAGLSSLGVDSQGNIYAGSTLYDGAEQFLARIDASGQTYAMLPVGGGGVAGIGVDGQDNIYFANNDGFIVKYATKAPSFGTVAVGATASTISLPFNITAGTTVGNLSFMTGTAQNLDFKDAGSDTCTFPHTFSSNTTCTINISFTPTAPGVRAGALIFADGGGNVLLSMALEGSGMGSLPVFNSHVETLLTSSSLQYPVFGSTVSDQSGNLYIAFASQNEILELPQGGAPSVLSLGSATTDPQQPAISATLSGPTAVAIDNAGKLYIADTGNDRIVVRQPVQGSTTGQYFLYALPLGGLTLNQPNGVATDAPGNVYIMDNGNSRVIKVTPSGHASVLPHVNIGSQPVFGFTADAAGNLYLCGNGEVVEYAAGSSTPSILYSGNPQGVALDAAGDLYIADYETLEGLVEIPVGGTAITVPMGYPGGIEAPSAISIDSGGNFYLTYQYGIYEVVRSAAALSYATTIVNQISSDSPQTLQLENAGNQALTLSSVVYPTDFPINNSDSSLCAGGTNLAPGAGCDISASFKPTSAGPLSESITVSDNAPGTTQSVSLTGTGSAGGQSQTITLTPRTGTCVCYTYSLGGYFDVTTTSALPVTIRVLSGPMNFAGASSTVIDTAGFPSGRLTSFNDSGAGSGVIEADQAGNSTYAPATPVQLSYTISPLAISLRTVSPGPSGTQVYGGSMQTFTYILQGVQPGDHLSVDVTSGVTAASPVGSYTANVGLTGESAANYTLSNPTMPFTVTPAPLTVEAADSYQLVGASPGSFTYALSGFQNGDSASMVTGAPTLTTTANGSSPAGSYAITPGAGTLAAANYSFTNFANGELNIFAPVNFGAVNVGSHFGTAVTFPAGLAPTAASEQLTTGGSTNGAFAGGYLACTPGTPGICTASVSFAPTSPGLWTGILQLFDSSTPANLLVTIPISGTGVGSQIAFNGGTQSVLVDNVTGANSMAFDGLGNMYFTVGNAVTGAVYELPAGGTLTPIGTGWVRPDSVVVDGAGNVYVSDYGLNEVIKLTPAGVQSTVPFNSLVSPQSLAIDASGNLYIYDANDLVYQLTPAGNQTVYYAGSPADGSPLVNAIAFSPSGQMYFVDSANGEIYTTPQGGPATVFSTAIPDAQSIAFDAAGNIYATSAAPGGMGLYELTPTGTVTRILSETDTTYPAAVALDRSGNLYIVNDGISTAPVEGKIIEVDRADAPSVNFPTLTPIGSTDTTDGPMTVSVSNIGNQPLTFTAPPSGSNPSYPANFPQNTADINLCSSATPLAAAASCDVSLNFAPVTGGANTGSVVLTDNALNQTNATQSISLTGSSNPQSQTIAFPSLPTLTYGAAPFTVSATASSGLAVSFASTTPSICTISGTTVTVVGGQNNCTIQATQAGNSSYLAAPAVSRSSYVGRIAQTITFTGPAAQIYGAVLPLTATASSSLTVSFASTTPSICTVSGTSATMTSVGSCTIQATQSGNSDYLAAAAVNKSFKVAQASQTITFAALPTLTYGETGVTLSATASSGLPVTLTSTTLSTCTVSGTTLNLIAGQNNCTIKATQAGNSNYLVATAVTRSSYVNRKAQSITFATIPAQGDGTALALSATASSGLAISYASTTSSTCTVSGTTATMIALGTCTIQATQPGNNDYLAAGTVNKSFKVELAQTITFPALPALTYGAAPFTVSATASSGLTVSFTSTTPSICTVSGTTVTLVSALNYCTIQATQSGNSVYAAAPAVTQTSYVKRATQSITFLAIPTTALSAGSVNLSATASSGLPVSFASTTTSVCTVSGTTATLVSTGNCTIQATQAGNTDYLAAGTVNKSFKVTAN